MRIKEIYISPIVSEKILKMHGVTRGEVRTALQEGNPILQKAKGGRYMAICWRYRCLTIIFRYVHGTANVNTAYLSSEWQKRLYKKKR